MIGAPRVTRARSLAAAAVAATLSALGGALLQRRRLRWSAAAANSGIWPTDCERDREASGLRVRSRTKGGAVIGSFRDESDALRAIKEIRQAWPQGFEAFSPELNEHFLEAMDLPKSPTGLWILAGAICGQFSGWAVTIMLSIYWPHKVGDMPVIAVPPFTILSFELMVLMAIFGGVAGLLFHAKLPNFGPPPEYMRRFQRDRIGIAVNCDDSWQFAPAEAMLRKLGAEDILRV